MRHIVATLSDIRQNAPDYRIQRSGDIYFQHYHWTENYPPEPSDFVDLRRSMGMAGWLWIGEPIENDIPKPCLNTQPKTTKRHYIIPTRHRDPNKLAESLPSWLEFVEDI